MKVNILGKKTQKVFQKQKIFREKRIQIMGKIKDQTQHKENQFKDAYKMARFQAFSIGFCGRYKTFIAYFVVFENSKLNFFIYINKSLDYLYRKK